MNDPDSKWFAVIRDGDLSKAGRYQDFEAATQCVEALRVVYPKSYFNITATVSYMPPTTEVRLAPEDVEAGEPIQYIGTRTYAESTGFSMTTARSHFKNGKVAARKVGGRWRTTSEQVEEVNSRKRQVFY